MSAYFGPRPFCDITPFGGGGGYDVHEDRAVKRTKQREDFMMNDDGEVNHGKLDVLSVAYVAFNE